MQLQAEQKIKQEEQQIINGCIEGKEKYHKILYERYYGKMLMVCMRYSKDREEAKDVLHEGYIRVFKNLDQYHFEGSFEGWIRKIMVNTSINYFKRNNMRNITDYVGDDIKDIEAGEYLVDVNNVLSEIAAKDLLSLIQQLPPAYKLVFNLHALEGNSHKEIAELLNITESTSRSNLTKARSKLQQQITQLRKENNVIYAG